MLFSGMNINEFWQIIDSVHKDSGGNMDRKCELLKDRLLKLETPVLSDFINHFDAADAAAYTWPLWGAAYVMHGGCSDDSFSDFRATLISMGRGTYERAVSEPESLSEINYAVDICYEGFQYVKNEVAEITLGEVPGLAVSFPDDPSGEDWDEDDLDQLYPKLSAKYSSDSQNESSSKPWWKFW